MRNYSRWKQLGVSAIIYLGAVVVLAGIGAGVFFGVKSYVDGVDAKAFKRGQQEAQVAYEKRDNEALQKVNKRILELQAERVRREVRVAEDLAALDKKFQQEKRNAKIKADRAAADARNGALRLRDVWRDEAVACSADRDRIAADAATGTTGRVDGTRGSELSGPLAQYLISEATRADEVVRKYTTLQDVVRKYLEAVNGR